MKKGYVGELGALIRVEDIGSSNGECFVQSSDIEVDFQSSRKLSREYIAADPVHVCYQIEPAVFRPDVGNINTPDLVNLLNGFVSQKIGIDLVVRMGFAQTRLRVDSLDTHPSHQSLGSLSANRIAPSLDDLPYSPRAIKGSLDIHLINQVRQL